MNLNGLSLEQIKTLITILMGSLTILGIVTGFFKRVLNWFWLKIKKLFAKKDTGLPEQTIVIVNDDNELSNFWHMGSQDDKPILQVAGRFFVTNITNKPVILVHSLIKGVNSFGMAQVKDLYSQYWGTYEIPPEKTTRVAVHFLITPLRKVRKGRPLKLNVALTDQFGNKHWIKNIVFKAT